MVPADTLRKLDLFDGLSAPELKKLEGISELVDYPRGAFIFIENEEARKLYIMLEGKAAVQFETARHQEAVVHIASSGEAFGWSAMVQPYRFTASARAIEDSRVVAVDGEKLRMFLKDNCHIGFVIMEKLAQAISNRLRETRLQLISCVHG
jgi:CRP/FNR family cyclic AMP-dependent transcriptional regulator